MFAINELLTKPYSAPISELIPVPKPLGSSTSGQGLETPSTVSSNYSVLTFVVPNYWSFRTCFWLPIVHYRPRCQNKISLWVYLNVALAFAHNCEIQDSGSGFFPNAQNVFITGGTFVVSHSCRLYIYKIIVHFLSTRTIIFCMPILKKGIWRLLFKNQTQVHCLSDGKVYLTSFGWFFPLQLIVN